MAGIGNQYHPFKAKTTIAIFLILAVLSFGPRFLPIPGSLSLIVLPFDMIHTVTIGKLINMTGLSFGFLISYSSLITYYLLAAAIGFFIHRKQSGGIP